MTTMEEMFGPIISSYSRAQAVEDGVLVDVSDVAKEAGFIFPVAMTRAAWEDLVRWDQSAIQDEAGRLWDVLHMAHLQARRTSGERTTVQLLRVPNRPRCTKPQLTSFIMHCGPGDLAEPVLTFMLQGES